MPPRRVRTSPSPISAAPTPVSLSRRDPPPHQPSRGRQASPRWYNIPPPQWYVLSTPLTICIIHPDCSHKQRLVKPQHAEDYPCSPKRLRGYNPAVEQWIPNNDNHGMVPIPAATLRPATSLRSSNPRLGATSSAGTTAAAASPCPAPRSTSKPRVPWWPSLQLP